MELNRCGFRDFFEGVLAPPAPISMEADSRKRSGAAQFYSCIHESYASFRDRFIWPAQTINAILPTQAVCL